MYYSIMLNQLSFGGSLKKDNSILHQKGSSISFLFEYSLASFPMRGGDWPLIEFHADKFLWLGANKEFQRVNFH